MDKKSFFRLIVIVFLIINLFVLDISRIFTDEFINVINKITNDPVSFAFGTLLVASNINELCWLIFYLFVLAVVVYLIGFHDRRYNKDIGKIIFHWFLLCFLLLFYFRILSKILEIAFNCDSFNKCDGMLEFLKQAGLAYLYGFLITLIYEFTLFFLYFETSKYLEDLDKILCKITVLIFIFIIIPIAFTYLNYSHANFPFIGTHCLLGSLLMNEVINFYRTIKKDPPCPNVPT
ncbi:hypothetical protein [Neisseria animaloris]|uniref:Uncharacterized protein n=1 Tax=Neisseria animaloris TaxID=326522 RepID=A0A3S5A5X2_9NEIS|nr:hypothetical protein [Neisseria animaloris]VEJ22342.1 Uncharacterised protein [Neisseria animaloris]